MDSIKQHNNYGIPPCMIQVEINYIFYMNVIYIGLGDITIYASRLLHRSALRYIAYCMTLDNYNL